MDAMLPFMEAVVTLEGAGQRTASQVGSEKGEHGEREEERESERKLLPSLIRRLSQVVGCYLLSTCLCVCFILRSVSVFFDLPQWLLFFSLLLSSRARYRHRARRVWYWLSASYLATLHYMTLHYTTLHYTALHYTTLHYTTLLRYTTLRCTTPRLVLTRPPVVPDRRGDGWIPYDAFP